MVKQEDAIGVFDSGLGGISVLRELKRQMPNENYIYYGDSAYAPYGTKSKEQIKQRCIWICEYLVSQGVKAIVIACNTATSACIEELRLRYAHISIIGMEPALKVAVDNKQHQRVRVLATKFTLSAQRFVHMASLYEQQHDIQRVACPMLVRFVEQDQWRDSDIVKPVLYTYLKDWQSLDSIVLGCTHFVFFKEMIQEITQHKVHVIDGNQGTVSRLHTILKEKNLLHTQTKVGTIRILNSKDEERYIEMSYTLLNSMCSLEQ